MPESNPRGIGRGLAAILPQSHRDETGLREISVELIRPNAQQPRKEFGGEALIALAESIKARGILQPLVVRPLPGGEFELIAGERRLRAAKMAELEQVPALVRDTDESDRLELALIENMAREDLNPVEEARACATLVEDLGITKEELGRRLGRSRVAISNLIRLLALPDEALAFLETGELTEGHGRAILLCKDHAAQRQLARSAVAQELVGARDRAAREGLGQGAGEREGADRPAPGPRRGDRPGRGRAHRRARPPGEGEEDGRRLPRRVHVRRAARGDRARGARAARPRRLGASG